MAKPSTQTGTLRLLPGGAEAEAELAVRQPVSTDNPSKGSTQVLEAADGLAAAAAISFTQDSVSRERHLRAVGLYPVLEEGLEDALAILKADRGNIQIVDPVSGSLTIAMQTGFSDEFLEYFAVVDDEASACGRAAQQHAQTVVVDVNTDPGFAPHREIAAASGFRAVQSTPLVDQYQRVVGVLSTHYPRPHCPPARELALIKRFGELIGQAIEASQEEDGQATRHLRLVGPAEA